MMKVSQNHNRPFISRLLLGSVMLAAVAGCQDDNWGYVSGTVTLNGQPIGPGSLMFEPEDPPTITTPSALAHFGPDGKYALKSAGGREGAPVGKYLVMVIEGGEETFGEEISSRASKQPSVIPKKYLNHRLSGLKAEVKPGSQVIDFPLEP